MNNFVSFDRLGGGESGEGAAEAVPEGEDAVQVEDGGIIAHRVLENNPVSGCFRTKGGYEQRIFERGCQKNVSRWNADT